jgi:hypothetical protein
MEFAIISDSKIISPRFSHSLSGLELMFNNFISLMFEDIGVDQEMILKKTVLKFEIIDRNRL